MLVGDWMSRNVVTVPQDVSMLRAGRILREHRIRRLPVVDREGRLVGIVTERDLKVASPSSATTLDMYEITFAEHKQFTIPFLDFRGTPTGVDIRKVVEKQITPRVNTGVAHKDPGVGQVGAGVVSAVASAAPPWLIAGRKTRRLPAPPTRSGPWR